MSLSNTSLMKTNINEKSFICKAKYTSEKNFQRYLAEIYVNHGNAVLDNLAYAIGMPTYVFLKRMAGCAPYTSFASNHSIIVLIEKILDQLDSHHKDIDHKDAPDIDSVTKCRGLKKLCMLAHSENTFMPMQEWVLNNAGKLSLILIGCVEVDDRVLSMEACYTIAFLSRKFHYNIMKGSQAVIAGLVRALAICMLPTEVNAEIYHRAVDRHGDLEAIKGRSLCFHQPKSIYNFEDVNHQLIACIYYTLADYLFSIPHPNLIHFYACRIFRRKEITRTLLFRIMEAVVVNIPDLQMEAQRLSTKLDEKGQPREILKTYQVEEWNKLPEIVYRDLLRVYIDRNVMNNTLIKNILNILRLYAPEKTPIFGNDVLKEIVVYNDSTNTHRISFGRNTETDVSYAPNFKTQLSSNSQSEEKKKIFDDMVEMEAETHYDSEPPYNTETPYDAEDFDDFNYSFRADTLQNEKLRRSTVIAENFPQFLHSRFSSFGF